MLEDSLREMFAARVETPPPAAAPDRAGRAIRRANAARRRRTTVSSLASVLAFAMVLGGVVSLRGWWEPAPVAEPVAPGGGLPVGLVPARPETAGVLAQSVPSTGLEAQIRLIGLDLRVGHQLWTIDGQRLDLSGVGLVTKVFRVPEGWVYGGADHVRLLRHDGSSIDLGGPGWLLSPDGQRLAVVKAGKLEISVIAQAGLVPNRAVDLPSGTAPVALAGEHVVISQGAGGPFDSLNPGGPYRPTWNRDVIAVYGSSGDSVTALVRDPASRAVCVAVLRPDVTGLVVRRRGACALDHGADPDLRWPSPDGAYLAKRETGGVVLVDLERSFSGAAKSTSRCPVRTVMAPAWVDNTTLVAAGPDAVVRCRTDGTSQRLPLPDGLTDDWDFVPTMAVPVS